MRDSRLANRLTVDRGLARDIFDASGCKSYTRQELSSERRCHCGHAHLKARPGGAHRCDSILQFIRMPRNGYLYRPHFFTRRIGYGVDDQHQDQRTLRFLTAYQRRVEPNRVANHTPELSTHTDKPRLTFRLGQTTRYFISAMKSFAL